MFVDVVFIYSLEDVDCCSLSEPLTTMHTSIKPHTRQVRTITVNLHQSPQCNKNTCLLCSHVYRKLMCYRNETEFSSLEGIADGAVLGNVGATRQVLNVRKLLNNISIPSNITVCFIELVFESFECLAPHQTPCSTQAVPSFRFPTTVVYSPRFSPSSPQSSYVITTTTNHNSYLSS